MGDLLIVDGYNIIYNWDSLAERAQKELEWSRIELEIILEDYAGYSGKEILLVYDGSAAERSSYVRGQLTVVYTSEEETADQYIERAVQEHKDGKTGIQISVATSDSVEQSVVQGLGAARISAREFKIQIENARGSRQNYVESLPRRSPLESRVDPGIYDKLEKIRRGIKRD